MRCRCGDQCGHCFATSSGLGICEGGRACLVSFGSWGVDRLAGQRVYHPAPTSSFSFSAMEHIGKAGDVWPPKSQGADSSARPLVLLAMLLGCSTQGEVFSRRIETDQRFLCCSAEFRSYDLIVIDRRYEPRRPGQGAQMRRSRFLPGRGIERQPRMPLRA